MRESNPTDAFATLSEEQFERLGRYAEERSLEAGEYLYRKGDSSYDFYALISATVEIVDRDGGEERVMAVHGPGRFLGEMNLLTGQAVYLDARVREGGQALAMAPETLREVIAAEPDLSEMILHTFLSRRMILVGMGVSGLRIVGSRFSRDTSRLREFAARNRLPHTWLDLEADPEAEVLLRRFGVAASETPLVVWQGRTLLRNPSNKELAHALGLDVQKIASFVYDLLVVGAGPAGLAASVYGASEGLRTLALDAVAAGGQAGTSSRIENYLGFPAGLSGAELASRAELQAEKFGALISAPRQAVALRCTGGYGCTYAVELDDGTEVAARSVVIATGVRYRRLEVDRLEELEGNGVYYAATQAEASLCAGGQVVVVGGGNSAGQACLYLTDHAQRVHLLLRGGDLASNMSRYLVERIESSPDIEVHLHTEVRELLGETSLEGVRVETRAGTGDGEGDAGDATGNGAGAGDKNSDGEGAAGEQREIAASALFTFIGADPCTAWLEDMVALDSDGFVLTGGALPRHQDPSRGWSLPGREPYLLETSRPGIFAAGDVRSGSVKRVASAVGEGSITIKFVHEYLARGG